MHMELHNRRGSLRRLFSALLALALVWSALPAAAEVTHGMVVVGTGETVNFRPRYDTSDFYDKLPAGWVAKVLSQTTYNGVIWYQVETNGFTLPNRTYTGYIHGNFFRMLSAEEEAAWLVSKPQPFTAASGSAPIPAATQPVQIPEGSTPVPAAGDATGTLQITKTSTNLRREPGGTSIWQYPVGAVLSYNGAPVFSGGFYWAKVVDSQRNLTGYVRSDCYKITSGTQITDPPQPSATPGPTSASVRITLGGTNLRLAPGGTVLATLNRSRVLPFYGSPTSQGGYNWVYVYDDASQQYGYVRSDCYEIVTGSPVITPSPTPSVPEAPVAGTLTLTKGGVNLRNAPAGLSIAQLERGLVLSYSSFVQQAGYTWYRVQSPKGNGYVRSDVIQLTQTPGATATPVPLVTPPAGALGYIVTVKSEINLRQNPSSSSAVLGRVDKAQVLQLMGPVQNANGYNWYQVNVNGIAGFLRGDCARQMNNTEVADYLNHGKLPSLTLPEGTDPPGSTGFVLTTTTSVNVRTSASLDARTLGQIALEGAAFPLLSTVTSGGRLWYKITYENQEGYLLGSVARMMTQAEYLAYLANLPTPTPPPAPTPTPPPEAMSSTAITVLESVIIRSGAGSQNRNLAIIYRKGSIVQLLGPAAQADGQNWYQVRVSGINGWIRGDLLRVLTKVEEALLNAVGDPDAPKPASYRTLQLGDSGEDVTRLQQELNRLGLLQSAYVNGSYLSQTQEAVREYQRLNNLVVDGIAGSNTQHKMYNTVPEGTYDPGGGSTVDPAINPVELVDWYTGDINTFWGRGETAVLTDVKTGISLRIKRWAGGLHVDGEPLTGADTAALAQVYGVKSAQEILEKNLYQRRPVWITLKGRSFAASLYGVPHNYPAGDTIPGNDFNGQLCVHFYNSRTHASGTVDSGHMRAIQTAYDAASSKK